jgi:PhnB protein
MPDSATKAHDDFHTITPHLTVRGAEAAVAFYCRAFGAAELYRNLAPDGKLIMHSELMVGDSRFFIHDEFPEADEISPIDGSPTGVKLHLYVDDVDDLYQRAIEAGATVLMPLQDCFWGDRYAIIRDPFGHRWSMATHIEDLSPRQQQKRAEEFNATYADRPANAD